MGLYVNPSEALLKKSMNSKIYVDKSMMIHELNQLINTEQNYVCVSRARRFGKSMMSGMLVAYYSKKANSRPLLEKLKIAQSPDFETHLNRYNVICFDMNAFYSNSNGDEDIVPLFTAKIRREMMREFPEAGIEDDDALEDCIAKTYMQTGEQFILIIDEYDVLVREQVKATIFNPFLRFLNGMFKNLSLSPAFALVYITGILPVVRDKIQSKLNVFREYTMINAEQFTPFVGFTEDEVKALCAERDMSFNECKRWYDGYKLDSTNFYNPCSVVNSMLSRKYYSYWTQTGSYDALKNYILMNFKGIRDDIMTMLAGDKVDVDVTTYLNTMTDFHSKHDVFTYLIHLGYLAYDQINQQCYIPNHEIRHEWINSIRNDDDYEKAINIVNHSRQLLDLTINGDEAAVAQALNDSHEELCANLQYNNEGCFQSVIRLAYFYANTRYTVVSEMPGGKGFADVAFIPYIPNIPAMIVELKRNSTTETALTQIESKQYCNALKQYQGDLLFIAVNYDEKTKEHTCCIRRFVV